MSDITPFDLPPCDGPGLSVDMVLLGLDAIDQAIIVSRTYELVDLLDAAPEALIYAMRRDIESLASGVTPWWIGR